MSFLNRTAARQPTGAVGTSAQILLQQVDGEDEKRLVALRAAMRAYPGIASIGTGPWELGSETQLPIRLHAIRAIFVTWADFVFEGVREAARDEAFAALAAPLARLDEELPDFYSRNIMGSDYAVGSWQDDTHAARRAVALVEAIDTLHIRTMPFDESSSYRDALETLSIGGPTGGHDQRMWLAAQRAGIAQDCAVLEAQRMSTAELAMAPLWPDARSAAVDTNRTLRKSRKNMDELGGHIETWLRERKHGALVLGMEPTDAAERIVRTANLPPSFWETREPVHTLYSFDYCLHGTLDNPNWGSETQRALTRRLSR